MLKIYKYLFILVIGLLIFIPSVNAEDFSFDKDTYTLRGNGAFTEDIYLSIPDGYSLKDVKFSSSDSSKLDIDVFFNQYIMFTAKANSGTIKVGAYLKPLKLKTYATVKIVNPIDLSYTYNEDSVLLTIDSYNGNVWSEDTRQAVEISVMPINSKKTNFVILGESTFGHALNDIYEYKITKPSKVVVRQISWWTGLFYDGKISEIDRNTIDIKYMVETPKNVKAKAIKNKKVLLSWDELEYADGYKIYKYNKKSKSYKYIGSTINNIYTTSKDNKKGQVSKYKIKAYKNMNGVIRYSNFSKVVSVKVK